MWTPRNNHYGYGLISYVNDNENLTVAVVLKLASSPVHAPVIVAPLHTQPVRDRTLHSNSVHPVHAHAFVRKEDANVDEIPDAKPKISAAISVIRNVC